MVASLPKDILGNANLDRFDFAIVGSGAAGSTCADILTRAGYKVLILEAGANYYKNLEAPGDNAHESYFSNDSLKFHNRNFITPDPATEPQTYRRNESVKRSFVGDVQLLARTVGGSLTHAGMKFPRFHPDGFRFMSLARNQPQGANFADWPVTYDELEPYYQFIEDNLGVQGAAGADPFAGPRSGSFPMPPGADMYSSLLLADSAKKFGYHPFPIPAAINSRPFQGRPACVDCGFCSDHGCPIGAKGLPAYTFLRKALRSGNAQLRSQTRARRLLTNTAGNEIQGIEVIGPRGELSTIRADRYILAGSPIEDVRLLLASNAASGGVGNANGLVGRNLMFHLEWYVIGIFEQRLHSHRGRDFTHAMSDFLGEPGNLEKPVGGLVCFDTAGTVIQEALIYTNEMGMSGGMLESAMKQSPLRDRFINVKMIGEDAPQLSNRVDLDPEVKDLNGIPAARSTYASQEFELAARRFYSPRLAEIVRGAGAKHTLIAPLSDRPHLTRHIAGTLRFGRDPRTSVCNPQGRFHEVGNLYAMDGSLFPTFPGFNPSLTIMSLASYLAAQLVSPADPRRMVSHPNFRLNQR